MARASLIYVALLVSSTSGAVEIAVDGSAGSGFVYATTDVEGAVAPWGLHLGTGYSLIGGPGELRAGWRGLLAYRGERVGAELQSDWAPAQAGRGWLSLSPRLTLDLEADDWNVSLAAVGMVRSVDIGLPGRRVAAVGQLQLGAELQTVYDDRIYLGVQLGGSFYSVDLHAARYRHADLGLLVTAAGRPESWMVAASVGVAVTDWLRLTGGAGAVSYAAMQKNAAVPKLEARVGPFAGVSVVAAGELAVVLTVPRTLLPIGALTIEIER